MAPLLLTHLESVALRLIRRFLLPKEMHRIGRYLPYYRMNLSETLPDHTCRLYAHWLAQAGCSLKGRGVVEIGSGATNGAGYALVCAGAERIWCVEPYVTFDSERDAALLAQLASLHGRDSSDIAAAVNRCTSVSEVGAERPDLILSHSVLEHVNNKDAIMYKLNQSSNDHLTSADLTELERVCGVSH